VLLTQINVDRFNDQMGDRPRKIPIRGDTIRLGQLLKLADVVDSGGEARDLLDNEEVLVNGERETRRGRQLHPGDVVSVTDTVLEIVPIDTP
jgi:ribosome-associated protein